MTMAARMNGITGSQRVLEDLYQARLRGIQPFSNFATARLGQQQGYDQAAAQMWNVRENLRARRHEHDDTYKLAKQRQQYDLARYGMETKHLNRERYLQQADFVRGMQARGEADRIQLAQQEADRLARLDQQELGYQSGIQSLYNEEARECQRQFRDTLNNVTQYRLLTSIN